MREQLSLGLCITNRKYIKTTDLESFGNSEHTSVKTGHCGQHTSCNDGFALRCAAICCTKLVTANTNGTKCFHLLHQATNGLLGTGSDAKSLRTPHRSFQSATFLALE